MYIYYGANENEYIDDNNIPIKIIGRLKRINILVGENNTGKSRFMRNIFSHPKNQLLLENKEARICRYISDINDSILRNIKYIDKNQGLRIEKQLKNIKSELDKFVLIYKECQKSKSLIINKDIKENIDQLINKSNLYKGIKGKENVCYIPILRGIENFEVYFREKDKLSNIQMTLKDMEELEKYINQSKTIYTNKVKTIYNIDEGKIFTAEKLYEEIVDILLGDETRRVEFHNFEKFIDDNFYDGKGFKINPRKDRNCLMVKIKNDKEYEMYNLGDGIKQIIVLLYQIFMHKDEEYMFFIEEPEINLHPGFQRKLMEILLSDEFSKHIYFINTHSNHIIDIINDSNDVVLYKFKKIDKQKEIKIIGNNYVSLLNELGIRSSSIFLSNCTIWVEGISDRIYLKTYLDLYFKEHGKENIYKENIHYSFVEYAGGNIVHWNFDDSVEDDEKINVDWLSHNIFLIVDNDDTERSPNGKKHLRKKFLQEKLKENFYELKSREIENIISLTILEKMLKKDNNLSELSRKKYNTSRWENEYTQERLSNPQTYLGEFIDETYVLNKKYKAYGGSKTIKNKAEFASKICKEIEKYDDLTDEAKDLVTKVAKFIEKNNGGLSNKSNNY